MPDRLLPWTVLLACSMSHAQQCLVYEDCSDGVIDSKWVAFATNPAVLQCVEQNGRLEFPAYAQNFGGQLFAGVVSDGWRLNLLEDWMVSVRYNLNFNSPSFGDTGLGFIVALDIDPNQPTLFTGYSLSGGTQNYGGFDYPYEVARFWQGGFTTIQHSAYRSYQTATVYVWYDADLDVISHGDLPGVPFASVSGLRTLSGVTTASVGLVGFSFGTVPPSPGSQSWGDDFCLLYGELVGPLVGACCTDGGCTRTLAGDCVGSWNGPGTTCEACVACEGDLDSDGQVNGADIARVLNDWGCAGDGCLADLDGNLRVDGADLTLVLNAWGVCGE
ncbi:MAG: hypothetical protein VXX30_08800 [Planctomycetota bacterium]|nr:hypothetical protein [Planctomycetota bacterium]